MSLKGFRHFFVTIYYTMNDKKMPKKCHVFNCDLCDFHTSKQSNWKKHIETKKHKSVTPDGRDSYKCGCGKKFNHRQNLHTHKKICKSQKNCDVNEKRTKNAKISLKNANSEKCPFLCECGNSYKHSSTLSRHKKNCRNNNKTSSIINTNEDVDELKKLIHTLLLKNDDVLQKCAELAEKPTTINNTQFNVMNYLNTECKDAMNLSDFINDFQFSLKDLEMLGTKGYQETMEQTFVKQLCDMDKTKRPIHCSDKKRKSFYIKDNNVWEKDNNNIKLIRSVKNLSNVHNKALSKWKSYNNDWCDNDKKHDFYLKSIIEFTKCDREKERNKIINKLSNLTIK